MEQEKPRLPRLKPGLNFRPLAAGRVFVDHPEIASFVVGAEAAETLQLCQGQPVEEALPEARRILDYDCTEEELLKFLDSLKDSGIFEGHARKSPRLRLFDPGPAIEFIVARCQWLFTAPVVVGLFALLAAALAQLLLHWDLFVSEVTRATAEHPWLSLLLYYLVFIPVGMLHELGHGIVCRWFGGEVLEVGIQRDSANPYVMSNKAALASDRAKILYFAGGWFVDIVVFFVLVNVWLRWPNYATTIALLPQAIFVLQYSYTMQAGNDIPKIVSQWLKIPEGEGRRGFVRELFKNPPKTPNEKRRAVVYSASIVLQTAVFIFLVWTFRAPVAVALLPGFTATIPFWPPVLYLIYRGLRKLIFNLPELARRWRMRPAEQTS
jgi:hypothetical protein